MPGQVDFYVRPETSPDALDNFACRLVEKVCQRGHHVLVVTASDTAARRFDDLLWTFRDESFVPHRRIGASDPAVTEPVIEPVIVSTAGVWEGNARCAGQPHPVGTRRGRSRRAHRGDRPGRRDRARRGKTTLPRIPGARIRLEGSSLSPGSAKPEPEVRDAPGAGVGSARGCIGVMFRESMGTEAGSSWPEPEVHRTLAAPPRACASTIPCRFIHHFTRQRLKLRRPWTRPTIRIR